MVSEWSVAKGKGQGWGAEREDIASGNIVVLSIELTPQSAEQDEKLTLYVQWENQKVGQVHIS